MLVDPYDRLHGFNQQPLRWNDLLFVYIWAKKGFVSSSWQYSKYTRIIIFLGVVVFFFFIHENV